MRILQLCNKVPYPAIDGGSIATFNLSKGFSELGHDVTILSLNTKKHHINPKSIPSDIKKLVRIITVDIDTTISSAKAFKNLLFSKLPYNAERFLSKNFKETLMQILQKEKFDIIQLEGLYMGLYIPVIRKYSNAVIALRAHNIEHEIWARSAVNEQNKLKKQYLLLLARRIKQLKINLINTYDLLIPITERDAAVFNKLGNKMPVYTAPAGINIADYNTSGEELFPSIFHIGALDWAPNQEGIFWFLDKIWPVIHKQFPEIKFYIAGRNASPQFSQKINIPNVVFMGEVPDSKKFMNSFSIMIVPLISGSGMRVKIIEGMALGKTIISTAIGCEGIHATNEKNILLANTPEEFTESIIKCITNKPFYEEVGKNARTFVDENFDNVQISKLLIEFFIRNTK